MTEKTKETKKFDPNKFDPKDMDLYNKYQKEFDELVIKTNAQTEPDALKKLDEKMKTGTYVEVMEHMNMMKRDLDRLGLLALTLDTWDAVLRREAMKTSGDVKN